MARDQRRQHALLAKLKGDRGEPFLPTVGQLYRVDTLIYAAHDPAAARPAVVVCVPPSPDSKSPIQIVTRTSQSVRGIHHPADCSVHLDRPGTFSNLTSAEQQLWRSGNVELLGVLAEPYLARVLERFCS